MDHDGTLGTGEKHWENLYADRIDGINEYLAESTGYGIVSGCTPTISGLTVTVAAGVVHLADGTRKEISATTVTLDAADPTNPRIDLVYIDSTGTVAKITGTAAASPSAPSVPANGISVAQVSVAANANTGTVTDTRKRAFRAEDKVQFLFPKTTKEHQQGDCQIIVTPEKTMMIDSNGGVETDEQEQYDYIIAYLKAHNIKKIDVFLLTHYHGDHHMNIPAFLAQDEIDFSECEWLIPSNAVYATTKNTVIGYFTSTNTPYRELSEDETIQLSNNCYVDLMCCNADIEHYIAEVDVDVSNENPRSIYALVRHGNVNVLYTGDGYYPETEFVRTTYNLPKVNLLKIPHHGVASPYNESASIAFFKEIAPDYAVFNHGWNAFDAAVGKTNLFGESTRYYQQFSTVVGAKVFHLSKDAEFISNGESLTHVSNNYPIKSFYNSAPIEFFVDASATEIPDGTKEKPFKSINAAIQALPVNASEVQVNITIKPAEYTSLVLTNFHGQINFNQDGKGNITIKRVLFSNCSDVTTNFTDLTVKQLLITKSNVMTVGIVRVTPDDTWSLEYKNLNGINPPETGYGTDIFPVIITGSKIHFYKLIIDGQSLTSAYKKTLIAHIANTTMSVRLLAILNVLSTLNVEYIFNLDRNSIVDVSEINTLENVYCPLFYIGFGALFRLERASNAAITSNTFTASSIFTSYNLKAMTYNYPGPSVGATTSRPNSKIVADGNTYYDTTLGHLLIWTGSKWLDCTTNADID